MQKNNFIHENFISFCKSSTKRLTALSLIIVLGNAYLVGNNNKFTTNALTSEETNRIQLVLLFISPFYVMYNHSGNQPMDYVGEFQQVMQNNPNAIATFESIIAPYRTQPINNISFETLHNELKEWLLQERTRLAEDTPTPEQIWEENHLNNWTDTTGSSLSESEESLQLLEEEHPTEQTAEYSAYNSSNTITDILNTTDLEEYNPAHYSQRPVSPFVTLSSMI